MLTDQLKNRIVSATVHLTANDGRGFLVNDGLVVTAAHCVDFECTGGMVMGDFYLENTRAAVGDFRLSPLAVEPCNDIAVLGEPDNQQPDFQRDIELFDLFCEQSTALRLCLQEFELFKSFPVFVYTHEGKWVEGNARQCAENASSLFVEFDDLIKGGTSGSPIVNESGEVVAVVSVIGGTSPSDMRSGPSPRPHMGLPVWLVNRITGADRYLTARA